MSRVGHRLASVVRHVTATSLAFQLSLAAPAFAQTTDSAQTVEQLANLAYEQHAAGKYPEAIATYLKAYEISKAAEILFNVATIYDRKLHERELAADYYRRYIRTPDANPDLVKRATERLSGLKKEAEDEQAKRNAAAAFPPAAAPPAASTAGPATSASRDSVSPGWAGWRTLGIITGAVGLGSVTASVILGGLSKKANDNANSDCLGSGAVCASQTGINEAKDAGTFATASTIAFAAGLGLLATGIIMYVAAPSGSSSGSSGASNASNASNATVTFSPTVGTSGGGVSFYGRF